MQELFLNIHHIEEHEASVLVLLFLREMNVLAIRNSTAFFASLSKKAFRSSSPQSKAVSS